MSIGFSIILIFLCFLLCLSAGVPIVFALFGVSMAFTLILLGPASMYTIFTSSYGVMTTEIYVAIPMFILMAEVITFSGITSSLYTAMYKWSGGIRGGLAIGTVVICTLLAAMTGLGGLGVLTMGVIALPEMLKRGYDKELAVGCIPAGGALGPLIPPSVPMIVTAAFARLSVSKMFVGGIVPGLLISFSYCIYIAIRCALNKKLGPAIPEAERATWHEKILSLRAVILPIMLVVGVLGSLYLGIATPTEAASVGAIGAFICAAINRQLKWQNVKNALLSTVKLSGMVMWLIAGGACLGSLLSATGMADWLRDIMTRLPMNPILIIISMQLVALILGCLIDQATITVICIPLFIPVVISLGFDPLWFCLLFSINIIIGYITPPFGFNLFYMKGVSPQGITMGLIYRSVMPYVYIDLAVMVLCFIFPDILLWLPSMTK